MKPYNHVDQQLHWLCQLLAQANRTFLPKKEDDSHTNLYFDPLGNRITGRWIPTKEASLIFTLDLANLDIQIISETHQVLASYPTIGKLLADVESDINEQLPEWGLTSSGFREKLHFEIPDYHFVQQPVQPLDAKALEAWKHFRRLANEACSLLLGYTQNLAEIRIWPHHFDTGIFTSINHRISIGFGLAMEDKMAGAPYFYLSGYPTSGEIDYHRLPAANEWTWKIGDRWKGAILPLDQLAGKTNADQQKILQHYLRSTVKWYAMNG
jgi:hypothetical protein